MPSSIVTARILFRQSLFLIAIVACESKEHGELGHSSEEPLSKQSSNEESTKPVESDDVEMESGSSLPSEKTTKPNTNNDSNDDAEESGEADTGDGTKETSNSESETSDDESSLVTMSAKVVDLDSTVIAGAVVSMCGPHELAAGCVSDLSADDGTVRLEATFGPGSYTIAVNPGFPQEGLGFSPVVFSAQLELEIPLEIERPIVFPQTGSPSVLNENGVTEASIDDELTLIASAATFKNPGESGQPYLAGVQLKAEQWPIYHLPSKDQEVLGVWALNPAGAFVDIGATPIGIKLSNIYKLSANSEVRFYGVDQTYGELELIAKGIVSEDGMLIESQAGEGLEVLSWLVVSVVN